VIPLVLQTLDDHLERLVVFIGPLLDAEHHVAVHLHEAAITVPREARIAGLLRKSLDRLVVEPEIQNGVHHPRHRVARARAHGDEQRLPIPSARRSAVDGQTRRSGTRSWRSSL
jgi:hypothetical protein